MTARVAVVVVNWNSGLLLRRCLRALATQTYAPAQVLVVDNASTDGSAAGFGQLHPHVRVLQMERNLGFAAANNLAAREAAGAEWLALVNPDAFPRPDWLERLLATARAHPDVSVFASRLVTDADLEVLDGTGDLYTAGGVAWRRGHGRPAECATASKPEVFSACAAAALYRRDTFLAMGGFDESFFCYFEDVDLGFRLRLAGHRCLYVPEAVAAHVGSAASGEGSDFARYHGHRNLVWTYVKNMPAPLLLAYLPCHLLFNTCALAWFTLRGQGRPVWRAKWHALRALPRVWRERRSVQAARTVGLRELMEAFSPHRMWLQDFRARRRLSRRRMAAPVAGRSTATHGIGIR